MDLWHIYLTQGDHNCDKIAAITAICEINDSPEMCHYDYENFGKDKFGKDKDKFGKDKDKAIFGKD